MHLDPVQHVGGVGLEAEAVIEDLVNDEKNVVQVFFQRAGGYLEVEKVCNGVVDCAENGENKELVLIGGSLQRGVRRLDSERDNIESKRKWINSNQVKL